MTPIWHDPPDLAAIAAFHTDTAVAHLGIEFLEVGSDSLTARMPADARTFQPFGVVHGGASVLLAETLGSVAAMLVADVRRFMPLGQEINANHLRPVSAGWVTGRATPIHLGRRSHVWGIEMRNDAGKLTCVSRLTVAIVDRDT